ncbi:HNH endonuclease (plasmid) [Deinococcus sp. QL22]|nr:HNH endonuclease [Deinococcus sp. QL22]
MNPLTIGAPESVEIEHQIPRSSGRSEVERLENMVAACRRCNNGAYPGKGEQDVEGFRMILADYHEAGRVVFFGEVLRWVRDHAAQLHLNLPLTAHDAQRALGWYREGSCVKLHSWNDDADYLQGLCLALPADGFLFPLGVPAQYWKPTQRTSTEANALPRARSA